jgi:nucleotide-binding universal stress UspA family protein
MSSAKTPYIILVAMAFDEAGDLALREAARTAQRLENSELHVVHVLPPNLSAEWYVDPAGSQSKLTAAREQLGASVAALVATQDLRVVGHIRVGAEARGVMEVAAEIDADLIVVGTHPRSGIRKLILGSVADEVLHDAHCPVLVAVVKDHAAALSGEVTA